MRTQLYYEGKGLGERWFARTYQVPIFSGSAMLRWLKTPRVSVRKYGDDELSSRFVRVETICQMEFVNRKGE